MRYLQKRRVTNLGNENQPKTYPIRTTAKTLDRWHKASRLSGTRSLREWIDKTLDREATEVLSRFNFHDK